MKPEVFALLTAICWGVGGFFEKQGLKLGLEHLRSLDENR